MAKETIDFSDLTFRKLGTGYEQCQRNFWPEYENNSYHNQKFLASSSKKWS